MNLNMQADHLSKKRNFVAMVLYATLLMLYTSGVRAESLPDTLAEKVRMIETEHAACLLNDGKLVSISLIDTAATLDVWVDRWFMEVQTADHTKQHLSAETPVADLGCSRTGAGPQRWTIHSIKLNQRESVKRK